MPRLAPLLAILLLLPCAWLAVPPTLAGQLEPELSAAGWWSLIALPVAAFGLLWAPRPAKPAPSAFALFLAVALLPLAWRAPTDTLSASRALLCGIASWVALSNATLLDERGRRWLVAGLCLLTLALCAPALAGVAPRLAGALGNSGATSEAALPGALAALSLLAHRAAPLRLLAALALVLFGLYSAAAPSLAGAVAFCAAAGLLAWRRAAIRRTALLGIALFTLAAGATLANARFATTRDAPTAVSATEAPGNGHFGGVGVRMSLARATWAMFRDQPAFGVGLGQFRAAFPPYREASERQVSNQAAGAGVETEVEHAHDDYLTVLAETGVLGALAWLAFLAFIAIRAFAALSKPDAMQAALASVCIGGLCVAALRAPLTFNPAATSLYFAAAGALLALEGPVARPRGPRRFVGWLALGLIAMQAPRAWAIVQHGRALRGPQADVAAALRACPDSPLALSLAARGQADDAEGKARARRLWSDVLARRPEQFEAWVQSGVLAAGDGDAASARDAWQRALRLAPERSGLEQNLLVMEARLGSDAEFAAAAERAKGRVERARIETIGANEVLAGDDRAGLRLMGFAGVPDLTAAPELLYERARSAGDAPGVLAKALETLAHLRWAREHVERGDHAAAVRSLRQALRLAPGAHTWRLELAAALWSAGDRDAARAEVERADAKAGDWTKLAPWAGDVLFQAGLFASR